MRNICVFTAARAEYGLLKGLMKEIQTSDSLQLQIIASGMHLSPEFGMTIQEIRADGFEPDETELVTRHSLPITRHSLPEIGVHYTFLGG